MLVFVLKDPNYFNIPESEIGRTTSDLIFYSVLFAMPLTLFVGYFYDRIGRRKTMLSAFYLSAFTIAIMPFVPSDMIILLFIARILY
jgi:MFS family permease